MLIQIGERTHHQLQLIKPVNLRPIKRIVSRPVNPIPPDEEEELLDIRILLLTEVL